MSSIQETMRYSAAPNNRNYFHDWLRLMNEAYEQITEEKFLELEKQIFDEITFSRENRDSKSLLYG